MKAVLKPGTAPTNVKPMAGGAEIARMSPGDYVFGDLSTTGSDIIGFSHFYRAGGEKFLLGVPCKVTVANMIKTNETEPGGGPDPDPDPTPDPNGVKRILYDDITYEANDSTIRVQRMVPE